MRLDPRFRLILHSVSGALLASGAAWLLIDRFKDAPGLSEWWQPTAPLLLMVHGGAAMLMLILFGALLHLHILAAWRQRRNLATGMAMLAVMAGLIMTAFALYYVGSESLRGWASNVHVGLGLGFPGVLLVHLLRGLGTGGEKRW